MRIAVFLLVLANLLFFVWARGYLGTSGTPDTRRVEQQLLADQLRIVSRGQPPPPTPGKEAAERSAAPSSSVGCQSWNGLASGEADQVERLLTEKRFAAFQATRRALSENTGYWVYVPPLASREEVRQKTDQLQQLGVDDFFIVQASGPNHLAISLGTYRTEVAARAGLAALQAKGVQSAVMSRRTGKPESAVIEIRGPESQAETLAQAVALLLPKASRTACGPASGEPAP
ncbi:MAG: SPOR domain-containing protein [Candidatus Accumulibacter sp. UW25]